MLSDKIAFIVGTIDDNNSAYMIPVTFTRFNTGKLLRYSQISAFHSTGYQVFDLDCFEIDEDETDRLSHVVFIDPKPGRKARRKHTIPLISMPFGILGFENKTAPLPY